MPRQYEVTGYMGGRDWNEAEVARVEFKSTGDGSSVAFDRWVAVKRWAGVGRASLRRLLAQPDSRIRFCGYSERSPQP